MKLCTQAVYQLLGLGHLSGQVSDLPRQQGQSKEERQQGTSMAYKLEPRPDVAFGPHTHTAAHAT